MYTRNTNITARGAAALLCITLATACGGDDSSDGGGDDGLEIVGSYVDSFMGNHEITETLWSQMADGFEADFDIEMYDNDGGYLIAQNGADNDYDPGKYSRFDWAMSGGDRLWYCQSVFAAETADEAEDAPAPDGSDPENGGCGEFSWSELIAQ